jgi:hypothetical protein
MLLSRACCFKRYRGISFCRICIVPMPVCAGFAGTGVVVRDALVPRAFPLLATDDDVTATIFIGRIMSLSS